jgi:hypothetical protein
VCLLLSLVAFTAGVIYEQRSNELEMVKQGRAYYESSVNGAPVFKYKLVCE